MDQLTWPFPLIAADGLPGLAIDVAQPVEVVANQYPMDRGGGHVEPPAQAVRAELLLPTEPADPVLHLGRGLSR
jgi:hypothetical protein